MYCTFEAEQCIKQQFTASDTVFIINTGRVSLFKEINVKRLLSTIENLTYYSPMR